MADWATITDALKLARAAKVTPWIWGNHGLGKSSLVKQFCDNEGISFVDLRCSQIEAAELRGLPDRVDGKTMYLPPASMPSGTMSEAEYLEIVKPLELAVIKSLGVKDSSDLEEVARAVQVATMSGSDEYLVASQRLRREVVRCAPLRTRGVLFLDELNRAEDDVIQAAFQLVYDGVIGEYSLPPGWSVVVAGNYMDGYSVNSFTDSAWLDRFAHLQLSSGASTSDDWVRWAVDTHGELAMNVVQYVAANPDNLDGKVKSGLGFTVTPSRRSWDAVMRVSKANEVLRLRELVVQTVVGGLIGLESAAAYCRFNCPVMPKQLLKDGVKAHESVLRNLTRSQISGFTIGLVAVAKPNVNDDKIGAVCIDYAKWLASGGDDRDLVVSFCSMMIDGTPNTSNSAKFTSGNLLASKQLSEAYLRLAEREGKKTFLNRLYAEPALASIVKSMAAGQENVDTQGKVAKPVAKPVKN